MNVIEDARNRVKSNAEGIGVGSRGSISNVVHGSLLWLGRLPRRKNNSGDVSIVTPGTGDSYAYLILPIPPVKPHPPSSRYDKGLIGDGEQGVEANTERANILFARVPYG